MRQCHAMHGNLQAIAAFGRASRHVRSRDGVEQVRSTPVIERERARLYRHNDVANAMATCSSASMPCAAIVQR
jgi:hypothetical protein